MPQIQAKLQTLNDVGLGYIHLGQSSTTLSGGEAQRIKLAKELSRRQTGRTFYILDEPTTGLHFDDVRKLLDVLQQLVELGNTVLVIEHHLDVMKTADWIIDLGPEGGEGGGRVVACGTPEQVIRNRRRATRRRRWRRSCATGRSLEQVSSSAARFRRPEDGLHPRARRQGAGGAFREAVSEGQRRARAARCDAATAGGGFASQRGGSAASRASRRGKQIIWGMGGHVIKCGLAPVLLDLMQRGYATAFAMNGSAAIHDFEIAIAGQTSEDVEAVLPDGRFGSAEETGREMNRAISEGDSAGLGMGEALGLHLSRIAQTGLRAAAAWCLGAWHAGICR